VQQGTPEVSSSQMKTFLISLFFYTLESAIGGAWSIPEMTPRHISCFLDAKYLACFKWY
jgi:hypothetical protein